MKNYLVRFALAMLFSCYLYSQEKSNSIYFEVLGNGGVCSLNYDRMFTESFGGRVGFMYLSEMNFLFLSIQDLMTIPVTLNLFVGKGNHKLELDGGIVYVSSSGGDFLGLESELESSEVFGTATIGYRYQSAKGGFVFRIGFTPFFGKDGFLPSGGVSLGVGF